MNIIDDERTSANMLRCVALAWLIVVLSTGFWTLFAEDRATPRTQVVLLGTGTPLPDPERAGPSIAVVVKGTAYLVDSGVGVVRRAAAARDKGVTALEPTNLRFAFLTHLHSDHTLGLADLMLTPWIMGRHEALELYGPAGTAAMADHLRNAYEVDIRTRTEGLEHSNTTGFMVHVHEIRPGVVYQDANVKVTAFAEAHGQLEAYGYRFEAADRTIVISSDTSPTRAVVENCRGCDVLIHEAYTRASYNLVSPDWQRYRREYHTSTSELGEIAKQANPGLLILFHRGNAGCDQARTDECRQAGSEEQLLKEMHQAYKGKLVMGHDLEVY